MTKRPDIPKRLAAKLRAAYRNVADAQSAIISSQQNSDRDLARISEYESGPLAFARKYYGNHAIHSYPVQTNISRCREGLVRRSARRDAEFDRLSQAEAAQSEVEQQVLLEVQKLRANTPGRVPWPRVPNSLARQRKIEERYTAWLDRRHAAEIAADDVEFEAQRVEEERLADIKRQNQRAHMDRQIKEMNAADREKFLERLRVSVQAVRCGEISGWDVLSEWEEIERDAERLARQGRSEQ